MSRHTSIGIIGTGWVGSSVAISCLHKGITNELLLADHKTELAEGEAMDLQHGSPFYPAASVRNARVEDMLDTDAIVIAAGRNGGPGQSRLELLRDNAALARELAGALRGYAGIVIMVTNPVDVLTCAFTRYSGLPPERVIGTGTMLDTARLRQVLGAHLQLNPISIHAQVVGEHGDSEVTLWSSAQAGGLPLRQWPGWDRSAETRVADQVRRAAYEIIRRKGATNHAIGLVTATLLQSVLRDERRILTVSRVQFGDPSLQDIALSLPCIVGADGAQQVLQPPMDATESAGLAHSAEVLRQSLKTLFP